MSGAGETLSKSLTVNERPFKRLTDERQKWIQAYIKREQQKRWLKQWKKEAEKMNWEDE